MSDIEGTVQKVAGRIQDTVGAATGDTSAQAEGKLRQAAGAAQQAYGTAVDALRSTAADSPFATIAIATAIGFVLGTLWAGRDD
jgi:uncharacterized protein YjbJ (UPF0337 family)